jgi:hypothetical protein
MTGRREVTRTYPTTQENLSKQRLAHFDGVRNYSTVEYQDSALFKNCLLKIQYFSAAPHHQGSNDYK